MILANPDDNSWNQRGKKFPVLQFALLALLCAILAYALSGTAG